MASRGQDISRKAGELTGQAQVKKDDLLTEPSDTAHSAQGQANSYAAQATNFIQETGEQVKNMAHEAAEAVKNSLGMNADDSSSPTTNNGCTNKPSNPSKRI